MDCKNCMCVKCDNDDCKWYRCDIQQPRETCFTTECDHYFNTQEEIDEGFLDGYEEEDDET